MSQITEEKLYDILNKVNETQFKKIQQNSEDQTNVLRGEIKNITKVINEKIDISNRDISQLKKENLDLQRKIRKNNIIVFGLGSRKDLKQENLLKTSIDNLNRLLSIKLLESDINNIYFVGKSDTPPIVIEFISYLKKSTIYPHLKKLKGTKVSISHGLCFEDRKDQKTLINHQKLARSQGLQTHIKNKTLFVNDQPFSIGKLKELENQGTIVTDSEAEISNDELETANLQKNNTEKGVQNLNSSLRRKKRKINYSSTTGENIQTRSQTKFTQKD